MEMFMNVLVLILGTLLMSSAMSHIEGKMLKRCLIAMGIMVGSSMIGDAFWAIVQSF
jgi:hypothetical protein